VLVESCLVLVQLAEAALAIGLAVPEFLCLLFEPLGQLERKLSPLVPASCSFLISMLSTNAWKRVRSWPEAPLTYSFSIEQTGRLKSLCSTIVSTTRS